MTYTYRAFDGFVEVSRGSLRELVEEVKTYLDVTPHAMVLIFSDLTGKQMDFNFEGSLDDVLKRVAPFFQQEQPSGTRVGRPKLGVISRDVSLLPIHWEWLENQKCGASATLRELVNEKMNATVSDELRVKRAQEITYNFLSAIAGNLPHFEDAIRYLYRKDKENFMKMIKSWHSDIQDYASSLSKGVF